jgi:hypothetical protein
MKSSAETHDLIRVLKVQLHLQQWSEVTKNSMIRIIMRGRMLIKLTNSDKRRWKALDTLLVAGQTPGAIPGSMKDANPRGVAI